MLKGTVFEAPAGFERELGAKIIEGLKVSFEKPFSKLNLSYSPSSKMYFWKPRWKYWCTAKEKIGDLGTRFIRQKVSYVVYYTSLFYCEEGMLAGRWKGTNENLNSTNNMDS